MKFAITGNDDGLRAKIMCEECDGSGVLAQVPVRTLPTAIMFELTVQNELREEYYTTYAARQKLPVLQRMDRGIFFLMGFLGIFGVPIMVAIGFLQIPLIIFLLSLAWIVVFPLLPEGIQTMGIQTKSKITWRHSQDSAQKKYDQILREYADVSDSGHVLLWIPEEDSPQFPHVLHDDSILVMEEPNK